MFAVEGRSPPLDLGGLPRWGVHGYPADQEEGGGDGGGEQLRKANESERQRLKTRFSATLGEGPAAEELALVLIALGERALLTRLPASIRLGGKVGKKPPEK